MSVDPERIHEFIDRSEPLGHHDFQWSIVAEKWRKPDEEPEFTLPFRYGGIDFPSLVFVQEQSWRQVGESECRKGEDESVAPVGFLPQNQI